MPKLVRSSMFASALVLLAAGAANAAKPALYPTNACASAKLAAAATRCRSVLQAWSTWEKKPNDAKRDAALAAASARMATAWTAAEAASTAAGADCADTTLDAAGMAGVIDTDAANLATQLNTGLDLGNPSHRHCGARVLGTAAAACRKLLLAHGTYVFHPGRDAHETTRDATLAKVGGKLAAELSSVVTAACPTSATPAALQGSVDALVGDVVRNATISPNVSDAWTMVTPPTTVEYEGKTLHPICSQGTPWVYFVKRGTVNKLLVYFQGGGACFDYLTCSVGGAAYKTTAGPGDNPAGATTGLADLSNPSNPFRDWNAVFVPYCTGDVHWGDATYLHEDGMGHSISIEHRGAVNAFVAEKFAREHFVAPDDVFVTGSSAGAYGAIVGAAYLRERSYPGAHFDVVGDAGNGVITQDFLVNDISKWGILVNLPAWIPDLNKPITELSIDKLWGAVANQYPDDHWGQYTSAYDGGGGSQTFFYQVMLHPGDLASWFLWWQASCDWHAKMRTFALATTAAAPNYRYYIGAGTRHTIWGSNKVYTDTTGGVPPFVDWLDSMLAADAGWTNVECTSCGPLPGTCSAASSNPGATCQDDVDCPGGACNGEDVRPTPPIAPFGLGGTITCP